ncbi:DUF2089 family protein [Rhizosphaericola mali]|uniref:DUF2089 domain-containing protein n=1 Tax=Rhizosphaericola mali TaxID=2545455 RepID=A0A5P2G2B3_9BACT|nr:DUF2089 family protein [Rhizosphaericola mali]QES89944.1 DUF2089 domain-containing protein [Rhizosphaericola mali]
MIPKICPSCGDQLIVQTLNCNSCGTTVTGQYPLPPLLQLTPEESQFVLDFVINSGNIKIMAEKMQLSYPTVRNYLDNIIKKLEK